MITDFFDPIQLEEMEKVKLMNRTDRKYWFHFDFLPELLQTIKHDYYILNIGGKNQLPYTTTYYDTTKNKMYASHHNGKLNRFKIRRRSYVASRISFLEIKFKSNKGRTIKKRIPADFNNLKFTKQEDKFISTHTPYTSQELKLSLFNQFSRLTLVNKSFKERCTIDLGLQFKIANKTVTMKNLVIIEIKSEGNSISSPLAISLRDHRIKTSGFSKYCVGRTITDPTLKRNAFKEKIRNIEKVIQTNENLFTIN